MRFAALWLGGVGTVAMVSHGQPGEIHHHPEKARDNAQRQDAGRPDQNKPADPPKPCLCAGGWVRSHQ
jgi:hypothetical protein